MVNDFTWLSEVAPPLAPVAAYDSLRRHAYSALSFKALALLLHPAASRIDLDTQRAFRDVINRVGAAHPSLDPGVFLLVNECVRALKAPMELLHAVKDTVSYMSEMTIAPLHRRLGISGASCFDSLDSTWLWGVPANSSLLRRAIAIYNEEVGQSTRSLETFSVCGASQPNPPASLLDGAKRFKDNAPVLWYGIQKIVSVICPVQNRNVVGFTLGTMPGVVFVNAEFEDEIWYAERLVHEAAHSKLFLMHECTPLITQSASAVYDSPWRCDKRPLTGILHGMYVHWHVAMLFRQLLNATVNCEKLRLRKQTELQRIK